jgi:CheY-like chemotaxis protein
VPGDIWSISANPVVLTQVLMNLCLSSRDALPQGGSLEIAAENALVPERSQPAPQGPKAGHHVLLSVRHGGTASATGWAAATALVHQHGGYLDVASAPGAGTTFRLYFPAIPEPPAVEAVENGAPPPEGNGELLLLVDDEGVVREAARVVLEGHGYRVLCAGSGTEALAVYADRWQEIALVLTDLMMPLMDGRSTLVALKKINHRAKVIAMSGLAQAKGRPDAVGHEFAAFLAKPFTVARLLHSIDDVLRR